MNAPDWLKRLAEKHGVTLTPETSPHEKPDEAKAVDIRRADLALTEARRAMWLEEFAKRPPTFARDLIGLNPKFLRWLAAQQDDVTDDLKAYWETEALAHPNISPSHERGQHARMTMVMAYAAEKHGYEID